MEDGRNSGRAGSAKRQQALFETPNSVEELLSPEQRLVTSSFRVALPSYEGPLDLLLHLIREHRVDVFDIPISLITDKYLDVLKTMKELDLDIAGEFLLMASTLTHLKSRMLLPDPEPLPDESEPPVDPRTELIRRLLDYQRYKAAAEELGRREILGRDVFARRVRHEEIPLAEGELGLMEVSVFKLMEALSVTLRKVKAEKTHQVFIDKMTLSEAITGLIEKLRTHGPLGFIALMEAAGERPRIVITFLALLELCKMRLVRVFQEGVDDEIRIAPRDAALLADEATVDGIKDEYR